METEPLGFHVVGGDRLDADSCKFEMLASPHEVRLRHAEFGNLVGERCRCHERGAGVRHTGYVLGREVVEVSVRDKDEVRIVRCLGIREIERVGVDDDAVFALDADGRCA